ncbi:hypothetical protein Tco_0221882 [Tanacetum coccineum]
MSSSDRARAQSLLGDHRKIQLNELNELRDHAYENSLIYKEKTKRIHDSKIKNRVFNVGDRVLLFNSRLKIFSGKLKTRWSGPFTITQVFPYGTVELSQNSRPNFKVNGHRIKHYFGGDVPQLVVPGFQSLKSCWLPSPVDYFNYVSTVVGVKNLGTSLMEGWDVPEEESGKSKESRPKRIRVSHFYIEKHFLWGLKPDSLKSNSDGIYRE